MNLKALSKHAVTTFPIIVGLAVLALYATRFHPVIVEIWDDSTALRPRNFCILNPFRDHSPETAVESRLEKLRAGNVRAIFPCLNYDGEFRRHMLEMETRYPILSWRLGKRTDEPGKVRLMYWVTRAGNDGEESVFFSLEKTSAGWHVRDYSAIY